jgi:secreted PhoX family phosphatase
LTARVALAADGHAASGPGYGALKPAGDELALPPGFQYSVVSTEGEMMADGFPVPKAMDGTATFPLPNGNILLIRNHEDAEPSSRLRPRPAGSTSTSDGILNHILGTHYGPRAFAYDPFTGGGTTTIEVEPRGQRRVVRQYWSLTGTLRNCAGGPTPWGSWLSGEETLDSASATGPSMNHGYVFEVPVSTTPGSPGAAVPLKRLGRFAHEAAAVDCATGIIYETEDQGDVSGFYRFVPERKPAAPGELAGMNGVLQMLKVSTAIKYETAVDQAPGITLPVSWVDIPNPDPVPATATVNGATASAVFKQGFDAGGAIFRRLEGCWYANGKIYFGSTNGGNMGLGQIWVYDPVALTIALVFESPGVDVLDFPDNIAVSPRGGIVVCEDGGGAQFIRGVSPTGEIFDFARNIHSSVEFAGACFSPDGQTLFVNVYGRATVRTTQVYKRPLMTILGPERRERALTLAIWGPWNSGLL